MKLKEGDTVALVSLSWGGAGDEDILWRYKIGKKRLKKISLVFLISSFSCSFVPFIYVFSLVFLIRGSDSIRILPYINSDVISKNPKIFMGYSDTTITHFLCYHAGLSSFYGPSLLVDFAMFQKIKYYH